MQGLLAYEAGSFAEAQQHLEAAVQGDAEARLSLKV